MVALILVSFLVTYNTFAFIVKIDYSKKKLYSTSHFAICQSS